MNDMPKGSTGVSIHMNMGYTSTGLTAAAVTLGYYRERGANVPFPAVALAGATAAWTAGGWSEVDAVGAPGIYRLDVPDAAWLTGARSVTVGVKTATDYVPRSFLLTTLPNQTPAGTAGGLPLSDANGNAGAIVNDFVAGKSPADYLLQNTSYKLLNDSGGGIRVGAYAPGMDPNSQIMLAPGTKIYTDASGNIRVGDYATGKDPGTYVLVTPGQKIATDAAHNVTVAAAGGATDWTQAQRDAILGTLAKFQFDAVNNVSVAPVSLSPTGFANVGFDGLNYLDAMRGVAAACMGVIAYDKATHAGSVSSPTNPNIIKIRFQSDDEFLTRTNVALTLSA